MYCIECCDDKVIAVSHGVDERGEWRSLECLECGKTWVEYGQRFQDWSQDEFHYEGRHAMTEVVAEITVFDVLHAMYVENIELTDENLETVVFELTDDFFVMLGYDLEEYVSRAINGRS